MFENLQAGTIGNSKKIMEIKVKNNNNFIK